MTPDCCYALFVVVLSGGVEWQLLVYRSDNVLIEWNSIGFHFVVIFHFFKVSIHVDEVAFADCLERFVWLVETGELAFEENGDAFFSDGFFAEYHIAEIKVFEDTLGKEPELVLELESLQAYVGEA